MNVSYVMLVAAIVLAGATVLRAIRSGGKIETSGRIWLAVATIFVLAAAWSWPR